MSIRNVLVTGGARGIGAGIVEALAAEGCNVAFCGRSPESSADDFLRHLRKNYPGKYIYYQCDIAASGAGKELLEAFLRDFGELHVLVNNAGVAPDVRADMLEMSEESFDRVMGINLRGPFFLTQAAAGVMIRGASGGFRCIINIGSVSADFASVNRGEYCISKAGVAMASKLWAVRLAETGICVYEVRPGVIRSDMTSGVAAKYDSLISGGLTLQRRWGQPEDVGRAVAVLASGKLPYSTGQVINVDGGLTVERF